MWDVLTPPVILPLGLLELPILTPPEEDSPMVADVRMGSQSATFFRCSFLGTNFSQMVAQSEYSSDLGAQKAPFWLPFWSPFWARLQK